MAEVACRCVISGLIFVIIALQNQLGQSFESVYDTLERRNSPPRRVFETSERFYNRYQNGNRYSTHSRNPSSTFYSNRPLDNERQQSFGNGYDNLGNGRNSFNNHRRFDSLYNDFNRRRPEMFEERRDRYDNIRIDEPRFSDYDRRGDANKDLHTFEDSTFRRNGYTFNPTNSRNEQDNVFIRPEDNENVRFSDGRDLDTASYDLRSDRPLTRRSDPQFYQRDYFKPQFSKTAGFASKNSDENFESAHGGRGGSGFSKVDSLIKNNEDKNQKKTDEGFQDSSQGLKTDFQNSEKVGETTRFDKNGGNKSTVRSNRVTKKGHSTKGFATHHHKDETGNSTTFFDESSDTGGQSDSQDLEDEFGSKKILEVHNGKEDEKFLKESGGKSGSYGNGFLRDNKKYEKDVLSNDDGFKKEERFGSGQDVSDQAYRKGGEYVGGGQWNSW